MKEHEQTLAVAVEGMHCEGCAERLAASLQKVAGVRSASVSFASREARVDYDSSAIAEAGLIDEIQRAGFGALRKGDLERRGEVFAASPPAESERAWKATLLSIPAVVASLIPTVTCPLCITAYTALLSTLGLGFLMSSSYLLPLTVVLLAVAVTALGYEGLKRHSWGPFAVGFGGSAVILAGKFLLASEVTTYSGVALLSVASVWNLIPRLRSLRIDRAQPRTAA